MWKTPKWWTEYWDNVFVVIEKLLELLGIWEPNADASVLQGLYADSHEVPAHWIGLLRCTWCGTPRGKAHLNCAKCGGAS